MISGVWLPSGRLRSLFEEVVGNLGTFDTWFMVMHEGNAADLMRRRIGFSWALTRWLDMNHRRRTGRTRGRVICTEMTAGGNDYSLTPARWLAGSFVAKTWSNGEIRKKTNDRSQLIMKTWTERGIRLWRSPWFNIHKRDCCLKSSAWR